MKKRYGLDNIIGKKSKLRFPSHVFVPKNRDPLYFTLPAYAAEAEPPLSTAITMKKGDPVDFVDQFNEESYDFEEGLPLNVVIYVSNSSLLFEIKPPSVSSLFGITFDLEDVVGSRFKAYRSEIFLAAMNFGLIHQNPSEDFFISEVVTKVKSVYGALNTFLIRRRKLKKARSYLSALRSRKAILNVSNNQIIKQIRHRVFKRYRKRTMYQIASKQVKNEVDQFLSSYDIELILEEMEDPYWDNLISQLDEDLLEYIHLSLYYIITKANLYTTILSLKLLVTLFELNYLVIKNIPSVTYILDIYIKQYIYHLIPSIPCLLSYLDEIMPYDDDGEDLLLESEDFYLAPDFLLLNPQPLLKW